MVAPAPAPAPRVVVITDRRLCANMPAQLEAILALVPRGSVAIQVREKDLDGAALLALARELQHVAQARGAPLWINGSLDVALAVGATGVHLPERGLTIDEALKILDDSRAHVGANPASDVRANRPADPRAHVGAQALQIGCSRHRTKDVIAAASSGASLVQFGPIWSTPGKGAPLGPEVLAVKAQLPPGVSLVAVGGIDSVERAREAALAGADAVAVIRAAWMQPPALIAAMVEAIETIHAARR